jgi:hypothetical protein
MVDDDVPLAPTVFSLLHPTVRSVRANVARNADPVGEKDSLPRWTQEAQYRDAAIIIRGSIKPLFIAFTYIANTEPRTAQLFLVGVEC